MREIKFRAWDILNKRIVKHSKILSIGLSDRSLYFAEELFKGNPTYITEFKLLQYTGLKDKNGVEIYEGDIVSHRLQGNRFVEYGSPFKNYGGYMLVSKNGMRGTLNDADKLYEVIGNIYENKELLNK